MRVDNRQIEDLEDFFNNVIVEVKTEGKTVTLTRADGTSFSFVTGANYTKGEKGDTGPKGQKGLSAYSVYVQEGGTLSEHDWLLSLIGPKGDKGDVGEQGDPGIDGISGHDIKLSIGDIKTDDINRPTGSLTKTEEGYDINLTFPKPDKGIQGDPGKTPVLGIGSVSMGDILTGTINKYSNLHKLNLQIPTGHKGLNGKDAMPADDGIIPDIKMSVNMISENAEPTVTKEINGNVWTFTLNIPKGKKGPKGPTGRQGKKGSLPISYSKIIEDIGQINSPAYGSFYPICFKDNDINYFGWSLRGPNTEEYNNGLIIQFVFDEKASGFFIRSKENGKVFGSVSEGWISSKKVIAC